MIIQKALEKNNDFKFVEFTKSESKIDNPYVVPNVAAIAREMTGSSQIGMIVKRFLALSFGNKLTLGLNNLTFMMNLLKKDFATGVKVLCELEILKIREEDKVKHFVLHNQMVDMSLAFRNRKVLGQFFYLSKKYGFVPGIISYNPAKLLMFLSNFPKIPNNLVVYTNLKSVNEVVAKVMEGSKIRFIDIVG